MAKLVSKFSNGHTDTYNGKRDVKVGWMITGPQGDFATGHSQDRQTAFTTASGKAPYLKGAPMHVTKPGGRNNHLARIQYFTGIARKHGFDSWKAHYDDYQTQAAAFRARCKIEIVEL